MRNARSIRLLSLASLATACAYHEGQESRQNSVIEYRTTDDKIARLDMAGPTITTDWKTIQFSDCSDSKFICFKSNEAKIVIPRSCSSPNALSDYLSDTSELEFIGFEGLSGNIFKIFSPTNKFAYGYHLENGLVQLIVIPDSENKTITKDRSIVHKYTYRVSSSRGPFACQSRNSGR